ncbi:MAG: hypothetical protein KAY32_13220 [Candidatus Eisenbacteria sp.]|nr:hypothetical protein [Candidatus Eisenbacteria bacterium]
MKQTELRAFVEGFLALNGGHAAQKDGNLLRVQMPPAETEKEGGPAPERLLAFGARAHRDHPDAELVAVGSAFLDRLIQQTVTNGRHAVVHRPVPAEVSPPPGPTALPPVVDCEWLPAVRARRPVFLFVYMAEYHTIDVPDDLVLVPYDPAYGRALGSASPLLEAFRDGVGEADDEWAPLPAIPTPGELFRSLAALDQRLQRRARKVKEASAIEIARETANIEAYYRQLIEEARHPVGRARQSTEEETARVRQLQLDWKRRVQEVSSFWEARGDVGLSAVGAVMEPCWAYHLCPCAGGKRRRKILSPYAIAECDGTPAELHCALCGSILRGQGTIYGRDLVCASHLAGAGEPAGEE